MLRRLTLSLSFLCCFTLSAWADSFKFATLGDTQDISDTGIQRIEDLIAQINSRQPHFTIHIGEFKGGGDPCPDDYYQRVVSTLDQFQHPVIFTPGDNDWTDCAFLGQDSVERLNLLRSLIYSRDTTLGQEVLIVERQSEDPAYALYSENARWQQDGVHFATFHNVGTNNNLWSDPQATEEFLARNQANLVWLEDTFEQATQEEAQAVVVITHANLNFAAVPWNPTGFDDFRKSLIEATVAFGKPVLLIHGDTHQHKVDKPMKHQGKTVANFTRLEVFGSPDLGVVYVHVEPNSENVFRFEPSAVE